MELYLRLVSGIRIIYHLCAIIGHIEASLAASLPIASASTMSTTADDSNSENLYETLKVSRDADEAAIKKAYLKLARDTHPDRCPGDEAAKERFQAIGRAYAVLKDPEKKKVYDASGIVDEESGGGGSGVSISAGFASFCQRRRQGTKILLWASFLLLV